VFPAEVVAYSRPDYMATLAARIKDDVKASTNSRSGGTVGAGSTARGGAGAVPVA
jgi:hypothetical protein